MTVEHGMPRFIISPPILYRKYNANDNFRLGTDDLFDMQEFCKQFISHQETVSYKGIKIESKIFFQGMSYVKETMVS